MALRQRSVLRFGGGAGKGGSLERGGYFESHAPPITAPMESGRSFGVETKVEVALRRAGEGRRRGVSFIATKGAGHRKQLLEQPTMAGASASGGRRQLRSLDNVSPGAGIPGVNSVCRLLRTLLWTASLVSGKGATVRGLHTVGGPASQGLQQLA